VSIFSDEIGPLWEKRLWEVFSSGIGAVEACLSGPAAWAGRYIVPLPTARRFATQPRHIDELARATDLEVAILSGLTFMKIRGLAQHLHEMRYILPGATK